MVRRLAAYRQARDGAERRIVHAVASPPQDRRYSVREFWATRSASYDAFSEAGIRGGVTVAHAYRTNQVGDDLYQTAIEHGEIDADYGRWRFLHEISDGWEDLVQYIEPAPHYHTLAAGKDIRGDLAPPGWIVENIRSLSRFTIDDRECYEDMAATAYYLLTHGAEQRGRQTTTYFGDLHPASFSPEDELTEEELAQIDEMVEAVVGVEEGDGAGGPDECPCDDCTAPVLDLVYLEEYLDDPDWKEQVRQHDDGGRRLATLRGVNFYTSGLTDRPPPSAQTDSEEFRSWLKRQGQLAGGVVNRPAETQQTTFSPSIVWSV